MRGFIIRSEAVSDLHVLFYHNEAPITCAVFSGMIPFSRTFKHARVSGQEIWIDDAPELLSPQENASVFTEPGEVVYGPSSPKRAKTANCMGIYYGEGRGLDACNIFGRVIPEDRERLKILGEKIWLEGQLLLEFIAWE